MKNFKEKILKLGKKRYCFISLLLAFLLGFSVLTALNGSKSGEMQVSALSAPTTKNINLNGVTYSYSTSLRELKNTYGLFNFEYTRKLMTFWQGEGTAYVDIENSSTEGFANIILMEDIQTLLDNNIYFNNQNNEKILSEFSGNSISDNYINGQFDFGENVNTLQPVDGLPNYLTINLKTFLNDIVQYTDTVNTSLYNGSCMVTMCYIPNDFTSADNDEKLLHDNSIIYNYVMSRPIDYTYYIPRQENYSLKMIYISFENVTKQPTHNLAIFGDVPKQYMSSNSQLTQEGFITISNVNFIENANANMLTFNSDYNYGTMNNTYPYFKGNLLLSTNEADQSMLSFIDQYRPSGFYKYVVQNFDTELFFGGNFNYNKPITQLYYSSRRTTSPTPAGFTVEVDTNESVEFPVNQNVIFTYYHANETSGLVDFNISYNNQNQLLYVRDMSTLRSDLLAVPLTGSNTPTYIGAGLTAQVQDVLYNVGIVTPEDEFNKRVEEDFIQLAKTTGLGALIGLILGFIFGNPLGGLGIGGGIGAIIGILPLIIDGIDEAIGGTILGPLIDILYSIFDTIAKIFASIVDILFEFLLSLITNPLVLILVAIFVLLYVFYFRKK